MRRWALQLAMCACLAFPAHAEPVSTYSISGLVVGEGHGSIPVILERVSNGKAGSSPLRRTVIADGAGKFHIAGLTDGRYEVGPLQPGYIFEPITMEVGIYGADVEGLQFRRVIPQEGLDMPLLNRLDAVPDSWLPEDEVRMPDGRSLTEHLDEVMPDGRTRRQQLEEAVGCGAEC